jgi:hypothetical protein
MKKITALFILFSLLNSYVSQLTTLNSFDLECETWQNEHIFFVKDVHYDNMTFLFVKINSLDDLKNITLHQCPPIIYKNQTYLNIFARKPILFNNDLNLKGLMIMLNRTSSQTNALFRNIKGFNENSQGEEQSLNTLKTIQMNNIIFDFYRQGTLLSSHDCVSENFSSKTNFFGSFRVPLMLRNVFYDHKICPYVFMNTNLRMIFLNEISNSLIFRNRVEFLNINETQHFNMNTKYLRHLTLSLYCDVINLDNLNPLAFKAVKYLLIQGNLEYIEENLFENFNEITFISIKSDTLGNFFHRGTKWLHCLNKNLNTSQKFDANIHKLISIEFDVQGWFFYNKYYTFPNEDICLFKSFPHSRFVLPLIVFSPLRLEQNSVEEKCSCTLIWLVQKYKYYFNANFTTRNLYVNLLPANKDYFDNVTLGECVRNEPYFNERFESCNFSRLWKNCDEFRTFKIVTLSGVNNFVLLLKWFQYVIEVYVRPILCSFGLITNVFTLKVILNKMYSKNFNNSMYKHIRINAIFNILFCLTFLFSLMNICIFPKNSFCSSIWRTEFSQYFHIYVNLFLGNTLRLCCNISYILFSISRFVLSGTTVKNKLRKFIEQQHIKRFYIIVFLLGMGFSSFLLLEHNVNKLYEEYDDVNANNNAYDVRYCEDFDRNVVNLKKFILTSGFLVKCKLFKWFNVINNILNNVLFIFVSICVDACMIRYSNQVIKQKKALNCPNVTEAAIEYRNKLNKMIITNGTLFFLAHIPELIITLIVSFRKTYDFVEFCTLGFDCSHLIEIAQTFHFISIGLQFFIFLQFDHNFKKSLINFLFNE